METMLVCNTDSNGIASTFLKLGNKVGEYEVIAKIESIQTIEVFRDINLGRAKVKEKYKKHRGGCARI